MEYRYHAYALAEEAFDGVTDKGGRPYFEHCKTVAKKCSAGYVASKDDLYCIGMLHDLLEDAAEFAPRLKIFPPRVRRAVRCLTKKENESYTDYIERVKISRDAIIVKLSDLEHNMDVTRLPVLTDEDISRLKKYHRVYNELKDILDGKDNYTAG